MAAVIVAGAIGLTRLALRVTSPSRGVPVDQEADRIYLVRSEVITVFVPLALEELARGLPDLASLESHDAIKSCLQREELEKTWYAILYRGFESNGNVVLMPVYGRPFETPWKMWEFRAILATIRGNPPSRPHCDFSKATISLIPEELANAKPSAAIADLIRRWELAELRRGR